MASAWLLDWCDEVDLSNPRPWAPSGQYDGASIAVNSDLRALAGTVLYLGYGLGATPLQSFGEMLSAQRYKPGYVLQ